MTVLNKTWPPSLREDQRWRILGNVILKRTTVCNVTEVKTDWKQLYSKRFHNLYSSLNIYYYNVQIKKKE
jgi:hypothetical protein